MATVINLLSDGMRAARVVADLHTRGRKEKSLSSEQKRLARHYAREGKTVAEIQRLLGLDGVISTSWLATKLRALNIRTNTSRKYSRNTKD